MGSPTAMRYRNLGDGYRHLNRHAEAAAAYRNARVLAEADVARNPRAGNARVTLALVEALLGDRRQAEFEVAQAVALQPDDALVARNAAITYEVLGQREKALALLRKLPPFVLKELSRQPDLKSLSKDPRFQDMMPKLSNP